jgi:hypothetical protein
MDGMRRSGAGQQRERVGQVGGGGRRWRRATRLASRLFCLMDAVASLPAAFRSLQRRLATASAPSCAPADGGSSATITRLEVEIAADDIEPLHW